MSSWSIRVSVLAVMLVSLVGCDSNPAGPAAPTTPVANAGENSQGGLKGVPKRMVLREKFRAQADPDRLSEA